MQKVSVIIPCYNYAKYLPECLNSVISQTFEDIEIICINDGSTDSTQSILEEYALKDERIRVFHQENQGISSARNAGIEKSNGKYIYFLDSDDYLNPDSIEIMFDLASQKKLDLLIFKLLAFDNYTGEKNYSYSDMPFLKDSIFNFEDIKDDLFEMDVTAYTKFYRKELLEDIRFAENLIFEDNLFFIEVIHKAQRIYFYDECLYNKRIHKHSIINSNFEKYSDVIEIFNRITDKIKEFGHYDDLKEKLFMRKIDAVEYRFRLADDKYKEDFFTLIKKDYESRKDQYYDELDFSLIDERSQSIFQSVHKSENLEDFELNLKISYYKRKINKLQKKNKRLKKENKRLNKLNREIITSNSWKLTEPLRKLKRLVK